MTAERDQAGTAQQSLLSGVFFASGLVLGREGTTSSRAGVNVNVPHGELHIVGRS